MNIIEREILPVQALVGRGVQKAIGAEAISTSERMSVGYARYAEEYGPMAPHRHAEEAVYVLSSERAWVRFGPERNDLNQKHLLRGGELLHIPEGEWHVFEHEAGGHVEIIFIYAQVDNIRPEN